MWSQRIYLKQTDEHIALTAMRFVSSRNGNNVHRKCIKRLYAVGRLSKLHHPRRSASVVNSLLEYPLEDIHMPACVCLSYCPTNTDV